MKTNPHDDARGWEIDTRLKDMEKSFEDMTIEQKKFYASLADKCFEAPFPKLAVQHALMRMHQKHGKSLSSKSEEMAKEAIDEYKNKLIRHGYGNAVSDVDVREGQFRAYRDSITS